MMIGNVISGPVVAQLQIDNLKAKIVYAILSGFDPAPAWNEYVDATGDESHSNLLPHDRTTGLSLVQLRQHAKIIFTVSQMRRRRKAMLDVAPKQTGNYIVGPSHTYGDGTASGMLVEVDDRPRAKMAVDYSGTALQGGYMGQKPVKGRTRNVALPVRVIFG